MSEAIIYRSSNIQGAGVFGYAPNPATNLTAKGKNAKVELKWTDPDDRVVEGTNVGWSYTRIVRKTGSYPTGPNDGTVVVQNSTKNQYQSTPYVDTGVVNNTTYYYAAYAFSDYGIPAETAPQATAKPVPYRVMTVIINEADSNPATCCSYADDAVDMPSGKTSEAIDAWQKFFGYKPCILRNGTVLGYLNPNDYSKYTNGSAADEKSGDDVMVEFPRRGLRVSKSGSKITISMTEDPDDPDFKYYAHTKGTSKVNYFYLGAYPNCITSLSLETPIYAKLYSTQMPYRAEVISLEQARQSAKNRGDGYWIMTWFQWTFIQCMFLLQFKNTSCQNALGYGEIFDVMDDLPSDQHRSGICDTAGLFNGASNTSTRLKAFGLEELWGIRGRVYADGITVKDEPSHWSQPEGGIYVKLDNCDFEDFNTDTWTRVSDTIDRLGGYVHKCNGSSEAAFIPIQSSDSNGSATTYYCDYSRSPVGECLLVSSGGIDLMYSDYTSAGMFTTSGIEAGVENRAHTAARLCYY